MYVLHICNYNFWSIVFLNQLIYNLYKSLLPRELGTIVRCPTCLRPLKHRVCSRRHSYGDITVADVRMNIGFWFADNFRKTVDVFPNKQDLYNGSLSRFNDELFIFKGWLLIGNLITIYKITAIGACVKRLIFASFLSMYCVFD